ncbi:MAG: TIGR00282 family metallophosphoesterase [Akkermansiaceae bacterium]|nr:TIGR00282 family metallophosphoesterase [Armatimonadota bacterium]
MKILFFGDIVGKPGRDAVLATLPGLRDEYSPDMVIANAENIAGGWGITPGIAHCLLTSGIDVVTMGNHTWAKDDGVQVIADEPRVLRPMNYPPGAPGRGGGLFRTKAGVLIGVANIVGRVFMEPLDDPFRAADEFLATFGAKTNVLFIDFHAETTSEKVAFGYHCNGRASVVVGTHTHVPTADERVLSDGTAYITDVGMCGPVESVIGMDVEAILQRFRTQLPQYRARVAEGAGMINAVLVEVDENTGKARSITRVCRQS